MIDYPDWSLLADTGTHRRGGSDVAQAALAEILGDEFWRRAVDFDVSHLLSEPVHSVLRFVRAPVVVAEAKRILRTETGERRRNAALLLADIVDEHDLDLVREMLGDADQFVAGNGSRLLHRLILDRDLPSAEAAPLVELVLLHPDERMRGMGEDLLEALAEDDD